MRKHGDRQATRWWAKSGPPCMGLRQESRWTRRDTCTGADRPALRAAPVQRLSCRNQGEPEWPESPLISLLYLSRSTSPPGDAARNVDDIVAKSRSRNPQLGLTGALLFTGQHFAQVLEGSAASVDLLMLQVTADDRHDEIIVVARESIVTRRFGAWSMAYSGPSQFVARHVTRLLNTPALSEQNRSIEWLNDLMWEFAEGPGAT